MAAGPMGDAESCGGQGEGGEDGGAGSAPQERFGDGRLAPWQLSRALSAQPESQPGWARAALRADPLDRLLHGN